ncbi:MAG TPA: excinuclease ABC subunit UvrC [Tepidisphaeraceae bacterium]|nr:excinuclease ABC subunit UvrC [Tepidisphaeraceae bacterium]
MSDRIAKLNEKAKALPKSPGVYLMKDDKGRVIYVGKSASLRDRVGSYFQPSTKLEFKKMGLLDEVVDFDILECESEVEALLAENRLIKDIQPKFNARLMDDKTFPYLMITTRDDYPGVYVTREPQPGAKLYGPFTSVWALKDAVQHMQRAFKFRTCHLEILEDDSRRRFFRPCLLYAINQCTAPCADKIPRDAYADDIRRLIRFLDGNRTQVLRELEKEMIAASQSLDFEKAAKVRDEIKALQGLGARAAKGDQTFWQPEAFVHNPQEGVIALQKVLDLPEPPRILETIDIAHLHGEEMVGSKVTFIDGVPFKDSYRRYKIKHGQGNNDFLSIQEVVSRRYREAAEGNELYPDVICIDGGIGQLNAALEVFKTMNIKPPMVISLAKKEELIHVQGKDEPIRLARNNLALKLLQYSRDEAHRFAQHYHHILRRKATLEEDVRQGRRPPSRKRRKPASSKDEAPHSTIVSLPVRQRDADDTAE